MRVLYTRVGAQSGRWSDASQSETTIYAKAEQGPGEKHVEKHMVRNKRKGETDERTEGTEKGKARGSKAMQGGWAVREKMDGGAKVNPLSPFVQDSGRIGDDWRRRGGSDGGVGTARDSIPPFRPSPRGRNQLIVWEVS